MRSLVARTLKRGRVKPWLLSKSMAANRPDILRLENFCANLEHFWASPHAPLDTRLFARTADIKRLSSIYQCSVKDMTFYCLSIEPLLVPFIEQLRPLNVLVSFTLWFGHGSFSTPSSLIISQPCQFNRLSFNTLKTINS